MNPRFLAVSLWALAAVLAVCLAGTVRDAARAGNATPAAVAVACAAALVIIAVLANAGADLW